MDAYNNAMDKIGAAIIDWSDPDGTWRADREVRDSMHAKKGKILLQIMERHFNSIIILFLQYYSGMVAV